MDFFGFNISQGTLTVGPTLILMGAAQYLVYKHIVVYSERTVEELNNKSFLGMGGTQKTPLGGKITFIFGWTVLIFMLILDFIFGSHSF